MPRTGRSAGAQSAVWLSRPPVSEYRPEYSPAYLSNGLIGLRIGRIPLLEASASWAGWWSGTR
ncbi:hypothetical protein [Candidatus Nephthysia bennettiae]|uniref:Uncharacterized protein n=1 Tax=Candidatus Nephthysia bennettiae TaxID=3127016 RepID=A0A934KCJ8_9BACT|nr:hypothetical protein [Candidatus Dormibacteraeota bacterium]MBJ7612086.1 hypothetical protein [Candidatus Dormibacteraeota bacterium]